MALVVLMTAVLVRETPDDKWTEEQILSLLEELAASDLVEDRDYHNFLVALDELLSRQTIVDVERASGILFRAARQYGTKGPVGDKMAELLSRLSNRDEGVFQRFLKEIEDLEQTPFGVKCACNVVGRLTDTKKRHAVNSFVRILADFTKTKDVADTIADTIVSAGQDMQTASEVTSALAHDLEMYTPPLWFLYSLRIASRIGEKSILDAMHTILRRLKEGWFTDNLPELENSVCEYFKRFPVEEAVFDLAHLLKQRQRYDLFQVLRSFQYPLTANLLLDFVEQSLMVGSDYNLRLQSVMVLSELDPRVIDLDRLLSFRKLLEWPSSEFGYYAKRILVKFGDSAKNRLFSLYSDPRLCNFATECLSEMGISLDEISKHLPESPVSQMARFFHVELLAERLWTDKERLGDQVRGFNITKFEYMILDLFTRLNFVARFTEPSKKPGVDIVAVPTTGTHIIVVGATTGAVKEDLQQLNETMIDLRQTSPSLTKTNVLLPALFTILESFMPSDLEFAKGNGIALVSSIDLQKILVMAKTSQRSSDLIRFLLSRIPS